MAKKTARQEAWQGSSWIRKDLRLAIYLRDGLACSYCGDAVENGAALSLDHVVPHIHGGTNEVSNFVTCCRKCNSTRGSRSIEDFAVSVASYLNHGVTAEEILAPIRARLAMDIRPFRAEAKAMIARRGSVSKVLAGEI